MLAVAPAHHLGRHAFDAFELDFGTLELLGL